MKPARHAAGESVRRIADAPGQPQATADPAPAAADLPVVALRRRHDG